ncbi:unnamed protein product [Urochloa humidicola]
MSRRRSRPPGGLAGHQGGAQSCSGDGQGGGGGNSSGGGSERGGNKLALVPACQDGTSGRHLRVVGKSRSQTRAEQQEKFRT